MNHSALPERTISITKSLRIFFAVLMLTFLAEAVIGQRAIINPSIETPTFANNQFFFYSEGVVPGWLTSHPSMTATCTNGGGPAVDCRPIERWSNGFSGVAPATGAGNLWVELNAFNNSMIYQNICMTNGESFGYSFVHRGRGSATIADVAQFRLGIPTGLPAGSKPADSYSFPIVQVSTTNNGTITAPPAGSGTINPPVAAGGGWVRYSGTYTYTGTTQLANIGFVAISSAGGGATGNFIDDWQLALSPYLEFSPANGSGPEGSIGGSNTPANRPSIRVGGAVTAPVTVTFQITGGSAVIGNDYSLTVPFQAGNTTPTATVTIPVGTYDGVSAASFFPVPFSIAADTSLEPDETVNFSITSAPGATIASVGGCGIAPDVNATYTIVNDDTTAAGVPISGRLLTSTGYGVANAIVTLSDSEGGFLTARSSSFGYFRFDDVETGKTYVLSVSSKRYQFAPRVLSVNDEITGLDLIAQ